MITKFIIVVNNYKYWKIQIFLGMHLAIKIYIFHLYYASISDNILIILAAAVISYQ